MSGFILAAPLALALQAAPPVIPSAPEIQATDPAAIAPVADLQQQPPVSPPASLDPASDGGDIVVQARRGAARGDPLEAVNAKTFAAAQAVDDAVLGPVAMAYAHKVPSPIRSGLRNFRYNLHEPVVAVNFLLQGKPGKAAETVGRFAVNTTIGVAGLFDMAKRKTFKLPRRRNGFANTMGFYGIKPGPFFFLPLIGPTTARDLIGNILDHAMLPLSFIKPLSTPAYTIPARTITILDHRAEFDEQLQTIRASADPYAARRDFYLANRQAEIDHLRARDAVITTSSEFTAK